MASLSLGVDFRLADDSDADGLIALIGSCYAEYEAEGCYLDMDGYDAHLRAARTHFESNNGLLWVGIAQNQLIACGGFMPGEETSHQKDGGTIVFRSDFEICRMYVEKSWRGSGVATQLLSVIINHIKKEGEMLGRPISLDLWSDYRFHRGHRFYAKEGFIQTEETRELHDISNTIEYHFVKQM